MQLAGKYGLLGMMIMLALVLADISGADPGSQKNTGGLQGGSSQFPGTISQIPSLGSQTAAGQAQGTRANLGSSLGGQLFLALDKDKDGVVTEDEFFGPQEKRFDALDKDHDRVLTRKEFESGSLFGQMAK